NTSLMAGLAYTRLSPSFEDSRTSGFLPNYALESPRHQVVANVNLTAGRLSATAAARFNERITYKSYFVGDMRVAYRFNPLSVYLDAQNIFNVTYIEAAAVPMPGRWFSLGVRYSMGGW